MPETSACDERPTRGSLSPTIMLPPGTMRTSILALVSTIALGACHSAAGPTLIPLSTTSDSGRSVATGMMAVAMPTPRHDIENFVAAFPAADSGGVCGFLPQEALQSGEWAAYLTFPASPHQAARRVGVRYDSTGALTYYSDRRGQTSLGRVVRQPDGSMRVVTPPGRSTQIDINLVTGFGLARNSGGDGPDEAYVAAPDDMLDAASLNYPHKEAALVRARCRSAA